VLAWAEERELHVVFDELFALSVFGAASFVSGAELRPALGQRIHVVWAVSKDMAASGIFPGDLLLKNFGVTRHGRVVFYDYDELTTLDECRFRELPQRDDDDLAAEPWFSVSPGDVFPEEFETFLGLPNHLRDVLFADHADIFEAAAWRQWQEQVAEGEIIAVFPYREEDRLRSKAETS